MKTKASLTSAGLLGLALMAASPSHALIIDDGVPIGGHPAVVTFNATGVPSVSGFLQFNSSSFNGYSQLIPNSQIVGFSMTVLGQTFDLGDVDTSAYTFVDSSALQPIIVNGSGGLADNGTLRIFFYPDGGNGTPSDGDAALAYFLPDSSVAVLPVKWVVSSAVPEPETYALMLGGLALVGWLGAKRRADA
ncbi:MAG: PEP-CTERM sorting domain-containing protein [Propionivibrio sp.]|uniref:PEP-CTERM sorting domain-containing protein n=1 Tax=Propionivibrio sp. TaxID=2212460 RepID=UPI001A57926D|nr:PEP-CTERM sorting domain-containing protein [Propionivibrio sp.]MBL8414795.1 PEP-CTERM sorting domain-containing protein [Propionivibrio sp.]